jgi:hypothetical protein
MSHSNPRGHDGRRGEGRKNNGRTGSSEGVPAVTHEEPDWPREEGTVKRDLESELSTNHFSIPAIPHLLLPGLRTYTCMEGGQAPIRILSLGLEVKFPSIPSLVSISLDQLSVSIITVNRDA